MTTRVLVTGAGGFIGHHLVSYLKEKGMLRPISSGTGYAYGATMCCISDQMTSASSSRVPVKGVFSHRPV